MYTIVRFAVCIVLFGAGHTVALNGVPAGFQTGIAFAATGSEGQSWFFYLENVPREIELTVDGVPFGAAVVRE